MPSNRSFDTDSRGQAFASLQPFPLVAGQLRPYLSRIDPHQASNGFLTKSSI
jgi:hypothetical protein